MRRRALAALIVVTSLGACNGDGPPSRGDSIFGTRESALTPTDSSLPFLDFDQNASDGSIALTFDDGPDTDGDTAKVLDVLLTKGVHATFFVNADNCVDVETSTTATALIQRMLAEGHEVGNHTYHHYDLGDPATNVRAELDGVDDLLHAIAPNALKLRLVRAPYGNPYYFGPQSRLDYVAPIAAQYGVHIGWNIDARDAAGCTTATCVHDNVIKAVDAGKSGIVLLHSIKTFTADALPSIIDDLKSRGKRFVGIESMVVAKYGKPSRRLFFCRADRDCISGERCGSDGHCAVATTTDAGTDTSAPIDSSTPDTSVADTSAPDTKPAPDTATPDTKPAPDTATADTKPAPDTAVADTKPAPDTALADTTSAPDTAVADTTPAPDTAVVDSDVATSAPDTNGEDAAEDTSLVPIEGIFPPYGSATQPVGGAAHQPPEEPRAAAEAGCGCRAAGDRRDPRVAGWALLALIAVTRRRHATVSRR